VVRLDPRGLFCREGNWTSGNQGLDASDGTGFDSIKRAWIRSVSSQSGASTGGCSAAHPSSW
jgi:hypothetical protein